MDILGDYDKVQYKSVFKTVSPKITWYHIYD